MGSTGKKLFNALEGNTLGVASKVQLFEFPPFTQGVNVAGVTLQQLGGGFCFDHLAALDVGGNLVEVFFISVISVHLTGSFMMYSANPGKRFFSRNYHPPSHRVIH